MNNDYKNRGRQEETKKDAIKEKMQKIEFLGSDGKIIPELLDRDAQKIAKEFKAGKLTTHQVRRFFDEVKQYQRLIETGKKSYEDLKPFILMLKSKSRYAATKKKEMNVFYQFIEQSIEKIKAKGNEAKSFEAFCLFFEAVYGFADLKDN